MNNCNFKVGKKLQKTNDGGIYRILNHDYPFKNIAVKLMDPKENENYRKEIDITGLATEIEIAPKVFDSCVINFEGNEYYGLVFEYIDNAKSINKIFQENRINLKNTEYIKQLLDVMYNNGIIHNDLHGENIIFNSKYRPYIIDFGMSDLHNDVIPFDTRDYNIELSGPNNELIILNVENNTLTKINYNFKTYKTTQEVIQLTIKKFFKID